MRRHQNAGTQPFLAMPVFQNWDVVAEAWYFACRSGEIGVGAVKAMNLCGQHVALYRGEDGAVRALDGFCPHMGTDLGIGTVKGDRIACFFHHWEFDGTGACRHIPCGEPTPPNACLQPYAAAEKFGAIWVFPAREAAFPLPDFEGWADDALAVRFDRPYERSCHHHVTMINGIDPQHLRTVHGFAIDMDLKIGEAGGGQIDFALAGQIPADGWRGRLAAWITGGRYGYAMRYSAGSLGLLTMAQHLRLIGRFAFPTLHMVFAYRPVEFGRTFVQPIFLAKKRRGPLGWLKERLLLWLTKRAFRALQGEDGRVYDNMRFNPAALVPMDRPIAVFIQKINQLAPSIWSRKAARDPQPEP